MLKINIFLESISQLAACVLNTSNLIMQLILSSICMALTSAVVGNAYYQKKQFYPAVVYITKSNASMAVSGTCTRFSMCNYYFVIIWCFLLQVIYVQFFVIVFMFGKLLRKVNSTNTK